LRAAVRVHFCRRRFHSLHLSRSLSVSPSILGNPYLHHVFRFALISVFPSTLGSSAGNTVLLRGHLRCLVIAMPLPSRRKPMKYTPLYLELGSHPYLFSNSNPPNPENVKIESLSLVSSTTYNARSSLSPSDSFYPSV
jgi:hypothetical protein